MKLPWGCLLLIDAFAGLADTGTPPAADGLPEFFLANNISEVRYAHAAMHISHPETRTILKTECLDERQKELLAKAACGSWKCEYSDDRVHDGMKTVVEFASGGKVVKRVLFFNIETEGLEYLLAAAGIPSASRRRGRR